MARVQIKDLDEANLALAEFVETYSPDKMGSELVSARALLPLFVTVKMLLREVQVLRVKSDYGQSSLPPMM